jgi:mono/diheme cytochrome c family protein
MPGEVQSCVGCHTDRNTVVPPVMESLVRWRSEPQELTPPDWGVKGFSYHEVVQPVLDKYCADCHNKRKKDGGLDLSGDYTDFFNVSYDHLARKGTFGEKRFRENGVRLDSREEGTSPYTSWIWTINGAEWNILEIDPKRWGSPVSPLAEIFRMGHPDKDGRKMVDVPQKERERVYHWIDLNVPYYPTSASNHRTQLGCRQMYPETLDTVLSEVAGRRCAECHQAGIPREFYTRFMKPHDNAFLLAPLAKEAGGTQKCTKTVFTSTDDPDYQKILETFISVQKRVAELPRADMPDFVEPPCQFRFEIAP